MTSLTVIGAGNVGSAVVALAAKGGSKVQVIARDRLKAAALATQFGGASGVLGDSLTGDIVVLAVPYGAVSGIVDVYAAQFDGKILVDVCNPIDMGTFDGLTVPADSSAAAELQMKVPTAKVLKAFNINFSGTLVSGLVGDVPTTVLVAGDDHAARQTLVDVVTAGGLLAVGIGSLKRARELEALALLQLTLILQQAIGWEGGFALRK